MAVVVPTSSLELHRLFFGLDQPLRAGQNDPEAERRGAQGVANEINHGFAYLMQCVGVWGQSDSVLSWQTPATTVEYGHKRWFVLGRRFTTLRLFALIENANVTLSHETAEVSSPFTSGKQRVQVDVTLVNPSIGPQWIRLGLHGQGDARLYLAAAYELPLSAGDFTW